MHDYDFYRIFKIYRMKKILGHFTIPCRKILLILKILKILSKTILSKKQSCQVKKKA